jgi:3-dehydroquinate dehydratase
VKSQIFKNEFMRTAAEIIKARYKFYDEDIAQCDVELNGEQVRALINEARKETIESVHEIVATMDWDVMFNTIDAKELQSKLNSLIKELR